MAAPIALADLPRFFVPTDLALAPDGQRALYALYHMDAVANAKRSNLWLADLAAPDAAPRPFTGGTGRDTQPRWSPDGRWVAFVSDREAGQQIWLCAAAGGEPRRLTRLRHGATQPRWSPDGTMILFTAEVRDDGRAPLRAEGETAPDEKAEAERLRHVTRLQYRWDGGDILEGREHLWLAPVGDFLAGGDPPASRQLTSGDFDHEDASWSPDGQFVAFVSDRAVNRDANRTNDVWLQPVAGGDARRLSDGTAEVARPAWSPDGRMIAWLATPMPVNYSISATRLLVAERASDDTWSHPRDLMPRRDLRLGDGAPSDLARIRAGGPRWDADGMGLYAPVTERGTVNLWWFPLNGGDPIPCTAGAWGIGDYDVTRDGRALIAITAAPDRPPAIARFALSAPPAAAPDRWITDHAPWLAERHVSPPERFDFFAPDNWWLEGWILWPAGIGAPEHAGHRWPVILQIHGGPHGFYGPAFNTLTQSFAGAGYVVVFVNPRGSVGYGQHFARACDADWGGGDYRDIMAGLDTVLTRYADRLDAERMAVTGTSYGGYMTNWIIGQTERFKAAVTINSVTNLLSIFGNGDMDATLGLPEYGGTPWERLSYFIERSPITYAPRVTTPTRIIGAERDWRCPISQSEEYFTALKLCGRAAVDFLRVPGASHSILTATPRQMLAQRAAILEWIERFVPAGPR